LEGGGVAWLLAVVESSGSLFPVCETGTDPGLEGGGGEAERFSCIQSSETGSAVCPVEPLPVAGFGVLTDVGLLSSPPGELSCTVVVVNFVGLAVLLNCAGTLGETAFSAASSLWGDEET
jgi:hypothetical protein